MQLTTTTLRFRAILTKVSPEPITLLTLSRCERGIEVVLPEKLSRPFSHSYLWLPIGLAALSRHAARWCGLRFCQARPVIS